MSRAQLLKHTRNSRLLWIWHPSKDIPTHKTMVQVLHLDAAPIMKLFRCCRKVHQVTRTTRNPTGVPSGHWFPPSQGKWFPLPQLQLLIPLLFQVRDSCHRLTIELNLQYGRKYWEEPSYSSDWPAWMPWLASDSWVTWAPSLGLDVMKAHSLDFQCPGF